MKIFKKTDGLKEAWKPTKLQAGIFIAVFALVGGYLLYLARASSILDNIDWQNYTVSEDTNVDEQNPNDNAGTGKLLFASKVDGPCVDPAQCTIKKTQQSYLKFNVNAIPSDKKIKRVLLRMHSANHPTGKTDNGGVLYSAKNNSWNQSTLTWANRPGAKNPQLASLGAVKAGNWYNFEIDLSNNVVSGNGVYSFVIQSPSADAAIYHSKESDYKPSLFIVFEPKPIVVPPPANTFNIPTNIANLDACSKDMPNVSKQINDWLKSLPDGATARFGANTCYRSEGTVNVANKKNLVIDGNGSKLQAFTDGCDDQSNDGVAYNNCRYSSTVRNWPRTRSFVDLSGLTNVTIKDLWLDGAHADAGVNGTYDAALEAQHGFNFNGTDPNDGVTLQGVHVDRVWGDYLYFGSQSDQNNVLVKNSFFGDDNKDRPSGNGRMMVAIVNGTNLRFEGNKFMNGRRSGVDIEPIKDESVIKNILFNNNVFGESRFAWVSTSGYGNANPVTEDIYFTNNRLVGEPLTIDSQAPCTPDPSLPNADVKICDKTPNPSNPASYKRKNFQFINNSSDTQDGNNAGRSIVISGVDGLVIKNNTVKEQVPRDGRSMVFVNVFNSRNVKITDNKALGSSNKNFSESMFDQASNVGRYKSNVSLCEKNNLVASPLTPDTKPVPATCS